MDSTEPVRYDRGGPSASAMFNAMRRGAAKSTSNSPWFKSADAAKRQEVSNAVEEAATKMAEQQALNQHVLDYFRRAPQVGSGGTLEQGRSYPIRVGGQHSDEVNHQLNGECSDAGRRLNECKDDGRHSKVSSKGMMA